MENLLNKIAMENYSEFGFATCSDEEQIEIIENYLTIK